MKRMILSLVMAFAVFAAARAEAPGVKIEQAWARATPPGAKTAAVYMTLVNEGTSSDQLVGASTPVADRAQLHTEINENGVMKMRPVSAVALKPGTRTVLKPGGMHLMLIAPKHPLKEGESFPVTLTFDKAGKKEVQVKVAKVGAMAPDDMNGMEMR